MDKLLAALYDYGPLGFFCAALILAIRIIWNALKSRWEAQELQHNENKARIASLEAKYEKYLTEDHATMLKALQDNTSAFQKLAKIMGDRETA